MIKLIASDMDGTLLNSDHRISKGNLEAIKKAQEMGIHFTIATGRIYGDVEPFLKKHGIECECILMNGAEYRDKYGNLLETIDIDKNKAAEIFDMMKNNDISLEIFTSCGLYALGTKEQALVQTAYRVQAFNPGTSFEEAIEIAKKHNHFTEVNYITDLETFLKSDIKIGKFNGFYSNEETTKKIKKMLESIGGLMVESTFNNKNVEINNINAQKGFILAKVAQRMGIKKDEVMVVGDSFNDYSMFTEFTESFAMENSAPEIKKVAKYMTDTNDNDGVAKAIYIALSL
ncbi:Cof-type HAD-IIB family hydrolase [Clostridium beijerinckii]|uniref:Putative phosphatase YwpJ n=1 Tax=Clostridium beijerinckii TaxID=1520 RepID=A0A1S8RDI0_CLOBE|nr:Cof-type HAD-IIB family hydrolase [Clostridium beijerinckii]NRY60109.1 hypothetical protein [Clostridium beijerinckii]OOM51264.1 putative phosphatase YwpJ [Clostridium beijerinckii]